MTVQVSAKPFSAQEQRHIIRWHGRKTYGDIARELSTMYADYNGGQRSADSVRNYAQRYEAERQDITIRVPRRFKERFSDLGLDHVDVEFMISECLEHGIQVLMNNRDSGKKQRGRTASAPIVNT